ncbi:MAG: oligosaccharide flippase family protein [Anaerolineae bacterium]
MAIAPISPRGGFAGHVLKLVGGTTAAQVITLLTAPIISRLYAPEAFGTLSVFVALVGSIGVVVCLRYEFAILLPERHEEAANVAAVCLLATLLTSALTALALWLWGEWLLSLLKAPGLARYLWLMPLSLLIQGVIQTATYWTIRNKQFGRVSAARVSASTTTSAVPIALAGVGKAGTSALIGSWVAGILVSALVLASTTLRNSGLLFRNSIRRSAIRESISRYRKFPLVDSWSAFINTLSWQLPTLMLSAFFATTVVGYYSLANRIILLPLTLVGHAISQVFFQQGAELRTRPGALTHAVEMVFRRLVALGLLPALILTILGQELFIVVFGAAWAEAGLYTQILAPWMFFLVISSPLSNLFIILERQELLLIVQVLVFISRVIALLVGGRLGNVYLTLALWSISGAVIYGGLSMWNLRMAGVSLRSAGRVIVRFAGIGLVFGAALLGLKAWLGASIFLLIALVPLAAAYYLVAAREDPALRRWVSSLVGARISEGDDSSVGVN